MADVFLCYAHADRQKAQEIAKTLTASGRTTVRYPAQATAPRPSVSRVRETCMHGLKGGAGNRSA
jgi:hypothetical protein